MGKRFFDIAASALGLLLLAPLFALIALAIKADSPGPVFFRQVRVGRQGRHFRIFKFRTMTQGAAGLQITVGDDARITRVGATLRRWKLDELPQLIDVLRGEMSLVGPRPEVPRYVQEFSPQQKEQVLRVRPGLTDLASLRFRNESELLAAASDPERTYVDVILPEKLRVSTAYLDHSDWRSDLRLLAFTVAAVCRPLWPGATIRRLMKHLAFWSTLERLMATPFGWRHLAQWLLDGVLVFGCWQLTYLFRLGFERWQPGRAWYDDYLAAAVAMGYLAGLRLTGAHRSVWRYFGFDDFRRLLWACLVAGLVSAATVHYLQLTKVSRAVLVLHPLFVLVALLLVRMVWRGLWEHAHALSTGQSAQSRRAIVVGANAVARRLIAGIHHRDGWVVLMLLDDDPALHGLRIAGVPVVGGCDRLADPMLSLGATHVVLALGEADAAQRGRLLDLARQTGLPVLEVPQTEALRPVVPDPAGPPMPAA